MSMFPKGVSGYFKLYLCFLMLLLVVNCEKTLNSNEYVEYFSKNRMKFSKVIERNGVSAIFTCHPPELFVAQTLSFDTTVNGNEIKEKYSRSLVMMLTIKPVSVDNKKWIDLSNDLKEFQTGNGKNAFLVNGKDTIYPVDYKVESGWNPDNESSFIFAFNKENINRKREYKFVIRNIISEIGTVEVPLKKLNRWKIRLRG
jgi:hypothetical protein